MNTPINQIGMLMLDIFFGYLKTASLIFPALLISISPVFSNPALAEGVNRTFLQKHQPYTGLYRLKDEFLVIGQIPEAEIFYLQRLKTGDMRFLREAGQDEWTYSPTRNSTDEVAGRVSFKTHQGAVRHLSWTAVGTAPRRADRFAVNRATFEISTADGATLAGELITPKQNATSAILILVPQSNRYNIYDVGMWALSRGIGVAIYDQRNSPAGYSTGPEPVGIYQEQMATYAEDAISVFDHLLTRDEVDSERIAIAGWSGGGLTAAFVAGQRPRLAGYVNIAGDASYGFEQASHLYVSRLFREGFSVEEIADARKFVDAHFGAASGTTEWSEYRAHIERVSGTGWYRYLSTRFAVPYSNPDSVLKIGQQQAQWPPSRVYGMIDRVPSLGVFFEWDHSSAPSTPRNFLMALRDAGNGHVQVSVIPDANHGGFLVDKDQYRFDTDRLTGRSPILIETVSDWLENALVVESR